MFGKFRNLGSFLLCSLMIPILLASPVLAGDNPVTAEDKSYDEEIVVTATRIPQAESESPGMTEIITGKEAQMSGDDTVSRVIEDHGSAVSVNGGDFSVAAIQLDGTSAAQTLVMWNGIPVSSGCTGEVDLSYLPTAGLEKIEIAHGPLSSLYGANALGGVVNIITDLTGEPVNSFSVTGGSYSSGRVGVMVKRENWGLAFGGNTTQGERAHSATGGYHITGQYDLFQEGEEYLTLHGQYLTKDAQVPGDVFGFGRGEQSDQRIILDVSGRKSLLNGSWEYKVFYQSWDNKYNDVSSNDTHLAGSYGADLAGLYELGDHEFLLGALVKADSFDSTISGKHMQRSTGLFVQDLWSLAEDLVLLSGLRWDYNTDYQSPLSPRLSITKYFNDDFSLKLGYGEAFRAPTVNDLYWNQPQYNMIGNPDLKPEKGRRYDITADWRRGNERFEVNLFRSELVDGITWNATQDWVWVPENIAKVKINGLNLRWVKAINEFLTSKVGYSWLDRQEWDAETESYVKNVKYGEHRLNLGLTLTREKWRSGLNCRYVKDRSPQGFVPTPMPDYLVADWDLSYRVVDNTTLNISVNNLTDEKYEVNTGYPMPGRTFTVGVKHIF